jgi:hypothetical protein
MTSTPKKHLTHTQAAQARANISSLLSGDPDREFNTDEVAEHLGYNARTAGQLLGGMAKGGLIVFIGRREKKKWWMWPTNKAPKTDAPVDSAPPSRQRVKAHPPTPKEVELEVFGITIIVGRNETTGRLRITLED